MLLKTIFVVLGLFSIIVIVILSGEDYEIIDRKQGNEVVSIEIKKVFGNKISEASLDKNGYYNGYCVSWYFFGSERVRQEGQFKNGFWHGKWYEYNRDGQINLIREWEKGKLKKLFLPKENSFQEIPIEKWPKFSDIQQKKAQKAK